MSLCHLGAVDVESTQFGQPPRLGLYHPATGGSARGCGVLICPPIAHEHIRAHRALRFLAVQLAREGFDVLRFDYFAVGDSAGESEEAQVALWQADVGAAAEELHALAGTETLAVVGVRFGATLAATAKGLPAVDHLVLWDPILDGRHYLAGMEEMHKAMLVDSRCFQHPRQERPGPGLLGFPFKPTLRAEIAACSLHALERWPSARVTVVKGGDLVTVDPFVRELRQRGIAATLRSATTAIDWEDRDAVGRSLTAGDVQGAILAALLEGGA
jgi:pimeloyl-ACP methyl ester carboxylesterase